MEQSGSQVSCTDSEPKVIEDDSEEQQEGGKAMALITRLQASS